MSQTSGFFKLTARKKLWLGLLAIIIITVVAGIIDWPEQVNKWYKPIAKPFEKFTFHLGLDLQGGSHLIYQADLSKVSGDEAAAMGGVRDVIERRINAFGVSEPSIQQQGTDRLIIELPGIKDVNQAIQMIGATPVLEFKEQNPNFQAVQVLTTQQTDEMNKYNTEAEKKAQGILGRALRGEGFDNLAKANSEDPGSKDSGGDLSWFKKGAMVKEFDDAVFGLENGKVSPNLVKTQFGYHIIKRLESRGEGDNLEVHAQHILVKTKSEADYQPPQGDQWLNTQLSGKQLKTARMQFDPNSGQPVVAIEFNDEGKTLFAEITKRNIQKPVAIFLDGQVISAPTVQEEILGGSAVISGKFTNKDAKTLAQRLNAGALPVPITLAGQQTVGATLGQDSLNKSLFAGLIGLLAVACFMLLYYRLPGLLAVLALIVYSSISLAIFKLIPVTLTLAGVAGFILSIGMAVDANILIFERLKEELKLGKSLFVALDEGFRRAWTSIRDSNISTLITCLVLYWFGTPSIRGFAVTLAIGVIISLFSAITVSRTFVKLAVNNYFDRHTGWFGASRKSTEVIK
jgi:protein-export membrane protein SecD